LVIVGDYSIGGYQWLFYFLLLATILLVAIDGYWICGY
jgi:hypothetical protein